MYPRNAASPEPIAIGPVVQISDGAVQTAGVTVRVKPIGVAEADGGGTTAYSTDGVVLYTPTQAETNYTSFVLIAKKTGCIPASVTVVTSASNTTGYAGTDQSKILNPSATVNLSATSIKTATDVETDTQDIQSRLPASLVDGRMVSLAQAVTDKSGYTLSQTFPSNFSILSIDANGKVLLQPTQTGVTIPTVTSLTNSVTVGGYSTGQAPLQPTVAGRTLDVTATGAAGIDWGNVENQAAVVLLTNTLIDQAGSVSGPVGEISGVTFPTHFSNLVISANGHVTATVDSINNNAITASSIQANAFTSAKFAADSITASALATDAAVEIAGKVWDEALTNHLTNGSTGYALNNAGGSGNPWITDLATGYTGTQAGNILNQVKAKTDLITTGTIQSSIPVTAQGQITGPLYIGDDYLSANGRAFQWTVALPSGFVIATSTCRFGMEHAEGATEGASFAVSGTVTDAGGGNVTLSFSVPKATTGGLKAGFYRWSVEIASASGNEVTRVASDGKKLVEWREKQT